MRYFDSQGGRSSLMFKGAITIFAFTIILISCVTPVTTQPPPLPPSQPEPQPQPYPYVRQWTFGITNIF